MPRSHRAGGVRGTRAISASQSEENAAASCTVHAMARGVAGARAKEARRIAVVGGANRPALRSALDSCADALITIRVDPSPATVARRCEEARADCAIVIHEPPASDAFPLLAALGAGGSSPLCP